MKAEQAYHAEEDRKARTRELVAKRIRQDAQRRPVMGIPRQFAAAAACLLLALTGSWIWFTPAAEISIDINPSLELSVNRLDRVIAVTGCNEDGQRLAESLPLRFASYTRAVETILESGEIADLLAVDETVTITVASRDEKRSDRILSAVESCAEGKGNADCYSVHAEEAAAHQAGLSCGRYRVFLELHRLDPSVTPEEVQGWSMREIRDRIEALSGEEELPPTGQGNGHHGHGEHH